MSCMRDATVLSSRPFRAPSSLLTSESRRVQLVLDNFERSFSTQGKEVEYTGAVPRDTSNSIYFTNYVTGASRREGMCYREYPP